MADTKIDTELAYFAGFFDGEGSVAIYSKKYVVSLTNTDLRPLQRAKDLWGGFLSTQTVATRPFSLQDIWRWQIYGHSARPFLEAIRPFSMLKAEQIDCYLEALSSVPHRRGARRASGADVVIEAASARLRLLKRGVA